MTRLRRRGYPPAWYRDPGGEGLLRRWNGWRWTTDTRPLPTWLAPFPVAVGPRRWSARRLLWAAASVSLVGALASLLVPTQALPPNRIATASYVQQAESLCRVTAEHFAATDATHADRASRTRARADAWAVMVASLRDMHVDDRDAAVAGRWLAAWDQWIVEGRAYAAALADGDADAAAAASVRSEPAKRVIDRIAIDSGMPACRFLD